MRRTWERSSRHASFTDVTEAAGLKPIGHSQTATFFDYDNGGWLDLYLVQTAEWTLDEFDTEQRYFPGKGDRGLSTVVTAPKADAAERRFAERTQRHAHRPPRHRASAGVSRRRQDRGRRQSR